MLEVSYDKSFSVVGVATVEVSYDSRRGRRRNRGEMDEFDLASERGSHQGFCGEIGRVG